MGSTITPSSTISSAMILRIVFLSCARRWSALIRPSCGPQTGENARSDERFASQFLKELAARTGDFTRFRVVSSWLSLAFPRAHTCVARPCLGRGGGSGVIKFLPVPFYSRALQQRQFRCFRRKRTLSTTSVSLLTTKTNVSTTSNFSF